MQNFKTWCVHALQHVILACAHGIVNTCDTQETARYELALGLPHYTCGVTTDSYSSSRQLNTTALKLIGFLYVVISIA